MYQQTPHGFNESQELVESQFEAVKKQHILCYLPFFDLIAVCLNAFYDYVTYVL